MSDIADYHSEGKSVCCGELAITNHRYYGYMGRGITVYYICTKCYKPCEVEEKETEEA